MSKKTKAHEEVTPKVATPVVENLVPPTAPITSVSNAEASAELAIEPATEVAPVEEATVEPAPIAEEQPAIEPELTVIDDFTVPDPVALERAVRVFNTIGGCVRKDY